MLCCQLSASSTGVAPGIVADTSSNNKTVVSSRVVVMSLVVEILVMTLLMTTAAAVSQVERTHGADTSSAEEIFDEWWSKSTYL